MGAALVMMVKQLAMAVAAESFLTAIGQIAQSVKWFAMPFGAGVPQGLVHLAAAGVAFAQGAAAIAIGAGASAIAKGVAPPGGGGKGGAGAGAVGGGGGGGGGGYDPAPYGGKYMDKEGGGQGPVNVNISGQDIYGATDEENNRRSITRRTTYSRAS